jgi:hypothetical protein
MMTKNKKNKDPKALTLLREREEEVNNKQLSNLKIKNKEMIIRGFLNKKNWKS